MSFCAGGKSCDLFVSHMNPLNLASCANRIRYSVKRIATDTIYLLNSCFQQNIHEQAGGPLCYTFPPSNRF